MAGWRDFKRASGRYRMNFTASRRLTTFQPLLTVAGSRKVEPRANSLSFRLRRARDRHGKYHRGTSAAASVGGTANSGATARIENPRLSALVAAPGLPARSTLRAYRSGRDRLGGALHRPSCSGQRGRVDLR